MTDSSQNETSRGAPIEYWVSYQLRYTLDDRRNSDRVETTEIVTAENARHAIELLEEEYGGDLREINEIRGVDDG